MNAHVPRIDNSPSPLVVSLSLSLSFSLSRSMRGSFTKPSRGGGEAIEWQLRTIVRSETKKRVGKLLPPRPRVETAASRCGEIGEMEDGLLKWSRDQERDRRKSIVIISSIFSFFLAAMMRITLKRLGIILHDETLRIIILNNRGIFIRGYSKFMESREIISRDRDMLHAYCTQLLSIARRNKKNKKDNTMNICAAASYGRVQGYSRTCSNATRPMFLFVINSTSTSTADNDGHDLLRDRWQVGAILNSYVSERAPFFSPSSNIRGSFMLKY